MIITPTNPADGQNITCSWNLGIDLDNDTLINETKWYKNNVENITLSNVVIINASSTNPGDNWTCSVRFNDSDGGVSSWINSSVVTINSAPIMNYVMITPSPAFANNTLFGFCNATDELNANITYTYNWYVNGVLNQSGVTNNISSGIEANASNISNIYTLKNQNWTLSCAANDSKDMSSFTNSSILILDTAPIFGNISINLSSVKINGSIKINVTDSFDIDNDSLRIECGNTTNSSNLCIGSLSYNDISCIFNSTWSDDTNHTIFCRINDGLNYSVNEINRTIISDNTKPNINLISPANSSIWNQSLTISYIFNVIDANNVSYCELTVDGVNVKNSNDIQKNINQTFSYYDNLNRVMIWNITCNDEAGNSNTSITWNINKTTEESFFMTNIGATGFESSNQNYTYSKLVIVNHILPITSNYCRYRNENSLFLNDWEDCVLAKEWFLSDYDGLKTVYVEINHTGLDDGLITNYSKNITLQSNGSNLDITPPENFNVNDEGNYSNKNTSFTASWSMPFDIETLMTYGKITFNYMLYDNTSQTNITPLIYTENLNAEISNLSLLENHTYILIVNATNPAGFTTESTSDGITIDVTPPIMMEISCNIINSSWTKNNNVTFNFTATDSLSGVKGFTMILDSLIENNVTDNLKEIENSNITYENLEDGVYYFHIKPYDVANNFGNTLTFNYSIRIDRTPPTKPVIAISTKYADTQNLSFEWEESADTTSGIDYYNITIINVNDTSKNYSAVTTGLTYQFSNVAFVGNNYYAIITAFDNAGNFIESLLNNDNMTPIKIISAAPNGSSVIVKDSPIIKVWTSKEGFCYANGEKFLYTNSEYHEIKLENDGLQTTNIVCIDSEGFKDSVNITYTVQNSASGVVSIGDIDSGYILKTITVPFNISGDIGQINKNDLNVYINDTEINDFSVDGIDNKGMYELKFTINEKGSYNLKIKFGVSEPTKEFIVASKTLSITNSGINTDDDTKTNMIMSSYNNKTFGIATDADVIDKSTIGDKINITIDENGKAYIFFTKKNINPHIKNEELSEKTFDNSLNSFGYQKSNDYIIGSTIIYDYITLSGLNYITPGSYNIFIRNLGTENKKTVISIEIE